MTTAHSGASHARCMRLRPRFALLELEPSTTEGAHDLDRCRPQEDDEEGREDTEHEREDELHRGGESLFLRTLTALDPHLVGLDPQHSSDGDTERLRLEHRQQERTEFIEV